jgi:hypothetical protein
MFGFDVATLLQWTGCTFGLLGSIVLAVRTKYSGYGFFLFLASNLVWMSFALATHAPGLFVMQLGFTVSSIVGAWEWVIAPKLKERKLTVAPAMLRI